MSTTTIRREDKEERFAHYAAAQAIQNAPVGPAGFPGNVIIVGGSGGWGTLEFTLHGVSANSGISAITTATYANVSAEGDNYFKPHFAKHLRQMLAAPLDDQAPEGEKEFGDWLDAQ